MMLLPAPKRAYKVHEDKEVEVAPRVKSSVPRYRHRKGFIPRKEEDFGDGGAFPEIIVAQYPLGMGKKGGVKGNALAVTVDDKGNPQFDSIVKHGARGKVYSSFTDLVQRNSTKDTNTRLEVPTKEEEDETAKKTEQALAKILGRKSAANKSVQIQDNSSSDSSVANPVYIKYSGSQGNDRVIRMVEAPVDPLELPKFKHKKQPRTAPDQPPVPIMHSQSKKLTAEDQANWKIPVCISNWKNPNGHTVPLDKRLVADGRGLRDVTVNDKFAKLSEALYIAENQARAEVEARNKEKQHLLMKAKEKREEELRSIAAQARKERDGELHTDRPSRRSTSPPPRRQGGLVDHGDSDSDSSSSSNDEAGLDPESIKAAQAREKLRRERKRERERELRLEAAGKKSKLSRDNERDVSEKIALGMAVPKTAMAATTEAQYDGRLFNQSGGLSSGFTDDSEYNVYSKPLFNQGSKVYRPKATTESVNASEQLAQLKGESKFEKAPRSGPVQFEREDAFSNVLNKGDARTAGSRVDKALGSGNRVGRGFMAAAGASQGDDADRWSSRSKIQFEKGKS